MIGQTRAGKTHLADELLRSLGPHVVIFVDKKRPWVARRVIRGEVITDRKEIEGPSGEQQV